MKTMIVKKYIIIAFILLAILLSAFFLSQKDRQIEQKKNIYRSIPSFHLPDIEGNMITKSSLQKDKSTLFLFFDSECDLCQEEFVGINSQKEALSGTQIVFFSTQQDDSIKSFLNRIAFTQSSNMFILKDKKAELVKTMNILGPPTSLIYNRKGNLIKRFDGPVKIETLIRYLSEE